MSQTFPMLKEYTWYDTLHLFLNLARFIFTVLLRIEIKPRMSAWCLFQDSVAGETEREGQRQTCKGI